jgi:hypothetical protein
MLPAHAAARRRGQHLVAGYVDNRRIAAPEMLPGPYPLPQLTCSRPGFTGGDEHEAGQHGNA